jgi:hypothetical protein
MSPTVVEAASSIIYATPFIDSKGETATSDNSTSLTLMLDLHLVHDLLADWLGPEFTTSASGNHDRYVPVHVSYLRAFIPFFLSTLVIGP